MYHAEFERNLHADQWSHQPKNMAIVNPGAKYLLAIQASRLAMNMQQEGLELTRCRMNPPELCQSCITLPRIIENSHPNEFIHQSQFETFAT